MNPFDSVPILIRLRTSRERAGSIAKALLVEPGKT